jgi:hypothetical protein
MATGFEIAIRPPSGFLVFVQAFVSRIHLSDGSSPVIREGDDAYKTFVQAFICRSSLPFIGQSHEDNKVGVVCILCKWSNYYNNLN